MTNAARQRVLLVVRHSGNARVLGAAVTEIDMEPVHADSESAVNAVLSESDLPKVGLVDPSGFGRDVWSLCGLLQEREIPFIVMAARRDQVAGSRSLAYGAASVLEKPVAKEALLNLLRSLSSQ